MKILNQSLFALNYLQCKSIMHRDIRLDNILLDENNNVKIWGFRESAYEENNLQNQNNQTNNLISACTYVGHSLFAIPEIFKKEKYSLRADIYSLGMSIFYLMSNKKPEELVSLKQNIQTSQIVRYINKDDIDKKYNIYLKKLVMRMLNDEEKFRPFPNEAYKELEYIEKIINEPNNQELKEYLDNINNPKNIKNKIHFKLLLSDNNQNNNI